MPNALEIYKNMNIVNQHSPIQQLTKLLLAILFIFSINASAQNGDATKGKELFKACAACHTLDKKLLGPPLKGITEKRDRKWLHDWIKNSKKVIDGGDEVGIALLKEYNNIPMPPNEHLTEQDIEDILAYTDGKEVKKEVSKKEVVVDPKVAVGKKIYKANCAACHKLKGKLIGPELQGISDKREKEWLHAWIKNNNALRKSGDKLAKKVFEDNNKAVMTAFPQLSTDDIDAMLAYFKVGDVKKIVPNADGVVDNGVTKAKSSGAWKNWIVILVILGLLIWMFLSKITFLKIIATIFLLFAGAWFGFGWLADLGVDQGYEPIQPIAFSHKIHAGDNKIDCQYCHSSAKHSKTSGIPTANVCMNCHKRITEVADDTKVGALGKPELDLEIKKIYDAIEQNKPIEWVRVHNLPDFAYYNHSQHVTVAGIECQTCHGPVEEMDDMRQHSKLTMGWCIDCHKTSEVDLDNKYYAKIHEDLSKKYGIEKVTVADLGGKECAKCHY
ncbi:MAG: c-type cytochrome [Flavobacteriaceae bacterium]